MEVTSNLFTAIHFSVLSPCKVLRDNDIETPVTSNWSKILESIKVPWLPLSNNAYVLMINPGFIGCDIVTGTIHKLMFDTDIEEKQSDARQQPLTNYLFSWTADSLLEGCLYDVYSFGYFLI
jgi:hypothetical protein